MSDDCTLYCSQGFDREVRELITDYDTRVRLFNMIDEAVREYADDSCNDCDYKRRYSQ